MKFSPTTLLFLTFFCSTGFSQTRDTSSIKDKPSSIFAHHRSFMIGFNPVHLFFGHVTIDGEFFSKKHAKRSTRFLASFGISEEKQRYQWVGGFEYKQFSKKNYVPNNFFVGEGVIGGVAQAARLDGEKAVLLFEPRFTAGYQRQGKSGAYLAVEAGLGLAVIVNGELQNKSPLDLTIGLVLGWRLTGSNQYD
jgi:hypothetical protein